MLTEETQCKHFLEYSKPAYWFLSANRAHAIWFRATKTRDVRTGSLARPFDHLLAPLTHSIAPPCSLHSRTPLCSFIYLFAHSLTHSRAHGKVMDKVQGYQAVLNHSDIVLMVPMVGFRRPIENQHREERTEAVYGLSGDQSES